MVDGEAVKARLLAAAAAMPSPAPAVLLMRAARHLDAGEFTEAAGLCWRAYGLDLSLDDFVLLFPGFDAAPEASLRKAEGLLAAGFTNARLTEIMAVMATRLGRRDDVRRWMDPDRLLRQIQLPSPGDAEMAELAQALQTDLAHYKAPRGRAIRHAARREGLDETTPGPPALQRMFARLRRAVADWIASLPTDPHRIVG